MLKDSERFIFSATGLKVDRGILQLLALSSGDQYAILQVAMEKWEQDPGKPATLQSMGINERAGDLIRPPDEMHTQELNRRDLIVAILMGNLVMSHSLAFKQVDKNGVMDTSIWDTREKPGAYFKLNTTITSLERMSPFEKGFKAHQLWGDPRPFLQTLQRQEEIVEEENKLVRLQSQRIKERTVYEKLQNRARHILRMDDYNSMRSDIDLENALWYEKNLLKKMVGTGAIITMNPGQIYLAPMYPGLELHDLKGTLGTNSNPGRFTFNGAVNSVDVWPGFKGIITMEMVQFSNRIQIYYVDTLLFHISFTLKKGGSELNTVKTFGAPSEVDLNDYIYNTDWNTIMLPRRLKIRDDNIL